MRHALFALVAAFLLQPLAAPAAGFSEVLDLLREAARAGRAASHYARTENPDLAAVELERAAAAWREIRKAVEAGAPEPFADPAFADEVAAFGDALEDATAALDGGDPASAHARLEEALARLATARRARGIAFWADCIVEMNAAMDRLWRWRGGDAGAPDLGDPETRRRVLADQAVTLYLYRRCRESAPEAVRDESFRRLFDGAIDSLARIPAIVEAREAGRLVSVLRELRSYDRLLRFRYG